MFGMRFDLRSPAMSPMQIARQYRTAIEMAAWADERGCMHIGLSEHHCAEDGYLPAPLMLASAMAAVTRKVQLIVAAALLPMYDPVRLAEEMIVLDHVSEGRVSYVLGIGYRPVEYELYGLEYEERGALADQKLAQLLEVLEQASAGKAMPRVTPASFTAGRPRLMWGGATRAAARRAGHHGLPFFAQTNTPGLAEAYAAACREAGFEPGQCLLPSPEMPSIVFVHPDPDAGWREVGPYMLADAIAYADWNKETPWQTVSLSKGRTIEALRAEQGAHRVVDIEQAVALVTRWGRLQLHPLCGGCPPEIAWTYLRRATSDVMPALGALARS